MNDANTIIIVLLSLLSAGLLAWVFLPRKGLFARERATTKARKVVMEDALRYLYTVHGDKEPVPVTSLSRVSGVPSYMLCPAVESLIEQGMVKGSLGEGIRLTLAGTRRALEIIRAHRLLEQYLAEEEDIPPNKVHTVANRREHEISPEEVERLAKELGNPTHDPHGAPIPDAEGHMEPVKGVSLSEWPLGKRAEVLQIEDEPQALVDQLVAMGLTPGSHLEIIHRTPKRLLVESAGRRHVLATSLADQMLVEEAPAEAVPLSSLDVGQRGVVREIRESGKMLRRMLDMGLVPGAVVEVYRKAPLGDPIEYRVMNSSVSLRNDLAARVLVRPLERDEDAEKR